MKQNNSNKKSLGIVGGMGSQASNWLLQRITTLTVANTDQEYLDVVLHNNSNIPDRTEAILYDGPSPFRELRKSLTLLDGYGVDVAVMSCMTAYYYYDQLQETFAGKLIHPAEFVIQELQMNPAFANRKKIGIIGSTGMISSGVFHKKLEAEGYQVLSINPDDQQKYFMDPIYKKGGFKTGQFSQENIRQFCYQAELLKNLGADIILGACSEIPLVMNQNSTDLPFLDSFQLLAERLVEYCHKNEKNHVLQA